MTTRERTAQEDRPMTQPPSESALATNIDMARDAGEAFLMAADRALDRALSTEPERFLQQNRQLGGQ
jgi:hypothetical protein